MTRRYSLRFVFSLFALMLAPAPAGAQELRFDATTAEHVPGALSDATALTPPAAPEELGVQLILAGRLADGETRGLDLVGDVLYRSNGGYFEALDVTTPASSSLLGRYLAPQGVVQGADVQAGLAYVAVSRGTPFATRGSLEIVNVSNPASMSLVGQVPGRSVFDVRVVGTTAYLATGGGGLRLYDVSNPAAPAAQGFLTVGGGSVLSVVPNGSVVYLAAGNAGLRIVDVSNPASPAPLGSLPALGGFATRVVYEAGRAYVSVQDVGMVVVDVSNPAAPVELGRYLVTGPSNFQIRSVAVSGTTAYIGKDDGIVSVDVTNPASPTALDSLIFGSSGASQYILLDGSEAYVGNRYHGVRVLDVADPAALSELDLIENGGFSFKVNVVDGIAYVADLLGQLRLVDVNSLTELGRLGGLSNADGVDVSGNTAYVVHRGTFDPPTGMISRVDVSNPVAPTLIDQQTTPWWAYGVDVVGSNVFVATGNNGTTDGSVRAYQDAGPLSLLDEGVTGNQAFDVRVEAGRAYVPTFGSGLSILDVSNPADIQPLSLNSVGAFATSIEVGFNDVVYMSDNDIGGSRGLSVIDVSNPSSPQLLDTGTTIAGGSPTDVSYSAAAYSVVVSVDFVGVYPFTVLSPEDIQALPSVITSDRATGVDAEVNRVVVADAGAGLWLFYFAPLPANEPGAPPAGLRIIDAGPNPFVERARIRFELAEAADVRVEAYSVLGRRVALLELGTLPAGIDEVTLDGRGWPAGHYLIRLTAGGDAVSTRLTRVR